MPWIHPKANSLRTFNGGVNLHWRVTKRKVSQTGTTLCKVTQSQTTKIRLKCVTQNSNPSKKIGRNPRSSFLVAAICAHNLHARTWSSHSRFYVEVWHAPWRNRICLKTRWWPNTDKTQDIVWQRLGTYWWRKNLRTSRARLWNSRWTKYYWHYWKRRCWRWSRS